MVKGPISCFTVRPIRGFSGRTYEGLYCRWGISRVGRPGFSGIVTSS